MRLVCKCMRHAGRPQKFHCNSYFTPKLQQFAVHNGGIMLWTFVVDIESKLVHAF